MMKALLFWWDPQHWPLARDALKTAGRRDLIGRQPHQLIPPEGAQDRALRSVERPRGPRPGQPRGPRPAGRRPR
jgi:hypothetical protein